MLHSFTLLLVCIARLLDFIREKGYQTKDFYNACRDIIENDDEVFGSRRFFIEAMLATSEYEHFFMLMINEMRDIRRKNEESKINHK